jgi:hypothetical protein
MTPLFARIATSALQSDLAFYHKVYLQWRDIASKLEQLRPESLSSFSYENLGELHGILRRLASGRGPEAYFPTQYPQIQTLLKSMYPATQMKKWESDVAGLQLSLYSVVEGEKSDVAGWYALFIKELRAYTQSLPRTQDLPLPLEESFTWKGLRIEVHNVSEKIVHSVLDTFSWVLALFKRRGLEEALLRELNTIVIGGDGYQFKNERTKQDQKAHGNYSPDTKTVRIFSPALNPDATARFLKNWVAEVFLHEFGHHIHLSVIPREAKAFWDSGWEFVEHAERAQKAVGQITHKEREAFFILLQKQQFDFQAAGRKLKPLARLKYLLWLYSRKLTTTPAQVRLSPKGKKLQKRMQDPREFLLEGGGMSVFTEREIDEMMPEEIKRNIEYARRRLYLNSTANLDISEDMLDYVRDAQKDIDRALDALGIPSTYGKTNLREDFAETFVLFIVSPDRLSETARWRMGRTLGMSASLGTPVVRVSSSWDVPGFYTRYPALQRFSKIPVKYVSGQGSGHPYGRYDYGTILLYPKWDKIPTESGKDYAFAHELGHHVETTVGLSALVKAATSLNIDVWDVFNLPFGQHNMSEAFADAFASYHTDKDVFRRYPEWAQLVKVLSKNV